MLTQDEERFLAFWDEKRKLNKFNPFFIGKGFTIGLCISVLIVICIAVGWNKQAPLNQLSIPTVTLAFLIISVFCASFYSVFKYDQNEQLYQELLIKRKNNQKI